MYIPRISENDRTFQAKGKLIAHFQYIIESANFSSHDSYPSIETKVRFSNDLNVLFDDKFPKLVARLIDIRWDDETYKKVISYLREPLQDQLNKLEQLAEELRNIIIDNFTIDEIFESKRQIIGGKNG